MMAINSRPVVSELPQAADQHIDQEEELSEYLNSQQADLGCCICKSFFDLNKKKPLSLPCGHNFCTSCLEQ